MCKMRYVDVFCLLLMHLEVTFARLLTTTFVTKWKSRVQRHISLCSDSGLRVEPGCDNWCGSGWNESNYWSLRDPQVVKNPEPRTASGWGLWLSLCGRSSVWCERSCLSSDRFCQASHSNFCFPFFDFNPSPPTSTFLPFSSKARPYRLRAAGGSQCVPVSTGRGGSGAEDVLQGRPEGRRAHSGEGHRSAQVGAEEEVPALRGQDLRPVGGARDR